MLAVVRELVCDRLVVVGLESHCFETLPPHAFLITDLLCLEGFLLLFGDLALLLVHLRNLSLSLLLLVFLFLAPDFLFGFCSVLDSPSAVCVPLDE